jgi:hypothetical protein
MRKRFVAIGCVSLVAVAGLVVALWPGGASAARQPQTLTFTDKQVKEVDVDNGAPQFSAGDEFIDHDVLYQNGNVAGKLGIVNTITSLAQKAHRAEAVFTAGAKIPGGTLTFSGRLSFPPQHHMFQVPIVGGTGDFQTARGYATVHNISDKVSRITVYLVP